MTPPAVQVRITYGPADPAQIRAWRWLWARLLVAPENGNAPEGGTPEASAHDGVLAHANCTGGKPNGTTDQLS
jgi:hypothetical protein